MFDQKRTRNDNIRPSERQWRNSRWRKCAGRKLWRVNSVVDFGSCRGRGRSLLERPIYGCMEQLVIMVWCETFLSRYLRSSSRRDWTSYEMLLQTCIPRVLLSEPL